MKRLLIASCIVSLLIFITSCNRGKLFEEISAGRSGIEFENTIIEKDTVNPIDLTNIYNGGGVGVGDFNNDGLEDLYFTGNQVANKLYLNKGDFKFRDVTPVAGVAGDGKWCRGAVVVDINNDGWKDIYVCASIVPDGKKRENLLYVNEGLNKDGIPIFKEEAAAYGLNDSTHTTMAAFFDYDNDGDLDVFLAVNEIPKGTGNGLSVFRPKILDGSAKSTCRLYQNNYDSILKHPVYKNVSKDAGILIEGLSHAVTIADFNTDGWNDIFVSNDFNSNDVLYINNHNGTFTDKATTYFKHTSANGMGQDVIDINNDGLSDVVEMDMNPEDNYRKKMMLSGSSYQTYQNADYFGYQYQYVRNTLQLNQGNRVLGLDTIGDPIFSDVGFLGGIAETDWSWTPLVADFDNDGYRDIIVTNGYPRDVTDHDFIAFRRESFSIAGKDYVLAQIPQVKLHNYAFKNTGGFTFSNQTSQWGFDIPSFTNGAVYADLDNDGDMDVVMNNINDPASIYRNNSSAQKDKLNHYLSFSLKGDTLNKDGLGAWIELHYDSKIQTYEQTPYRGYLSSIDIRPHFGLGGVSTIDSVVVKWPNLKKQVLRNIPVNQFLTLDIKNANQAYDWSRPATATHTLFTDISSVANPTAYANLGKDFVDFNIQKLLPHKFSEYGPALAAGDINGDGLDDIIAGESTGYNTTVLLQQKNGSFLPHEMAAPTYGKKNWDDAGILLFDADNDGDLDLYVATGGYANTVNSVTYQDRFYVNDGKGNYTSDSLALPVNYTSKSCVRAIDYDNDGDLDLFVAGRVEPSNYPKAVSCFIYRNDTKNGQVHFTDVTKTIAPDLQKIGLTCDALWTDFDNDGWQDLVLCGEYMPITFLHNEKGVLKNITPSTGIEAQKGWWTSIVAGDFDNDGDIDYVVGNLGLNTFFRASEKYPVSIYAKDFDNNGSYDAIPTIYLPASQEDTTRGEYPVHTRDDLVKQMIGFRSKFQNYKTYAAATFDKMFTAEEMKDAIKLQANYFSNSLLRNDGHGKFSLLPLPVEAQFTCLNGMLAEDFDGDGNLDILAAGNDFGTDASIGRYDACNGLLLKGDGKGGFKPQTILQSGWFVPGNAKAVVKLRSANDKCLVAVSQNRDKLKLYVNKLQVKPIALQPDDLNADVVYKNGKHQRREFGYGSSFMSQSARFINIDNSISSITIKNSKSGSRKLDF